MREILFRGKRDKKYNKEQEWAYGVPYIDHEGDCIIATAYSKRVVIPETVGQYTGLTDKNGKKIFEGDIVKTSHWIGVIEWCDFDASFVVHCVGTFVTRNTLAGHANLEVIGNIHDNPELLKGGAE